MIVAIYKDDGPANGCGQDITITAPREEAVIFPDYEAYKRADHSLFDEKSRINPRFVRCYEVQTAAKPFTPDWSLLEATQDSLREQTAALKAAQESERAFHATVAAALRELRAKIEADLRGTVYFGD